MRIVNTLRLSALGGALALTTGCASMVMSFGESDLSCPYPDGAHCLSLETAYDQSISKQDAADGTAQATASAPGLPQQALPQRMPSGQALLSEPQILRVWIGPWEDSAGRFHDQNYIYTVVREGEWVLKRNRTGAAAEDRFVNLKAPDSQPLVLEEEKKPERMSDEEAEQSAVDFLDQQQAKQ